jgi:hypothetical protein
VVAVAGVPYPAAACAGETTAGGLAGYQYQAKSTAAASHSSGITWAAAPGPILSPP